MSTDRRCASRLTYAAAASLLLLAIGTPSSTAAPTFDDQGYVDSAARCTKPDVAAVFGSTATSRVAICKSPDGDFTYRGVRLRDGARVSLPATQSADGAYLAESDDISYLVTADSLVISAGTEVLREETMVDFHGPGAGQTPTATTPTTPLPPPLPAEVGGSGAQN